MKKGLIFLVKIYKKAISPYMIRSCRFSPTCSEYAIEALERFGTLKGLALAARRVIRCSPLSRGGHDPVPVNEGAMRPGAEAPKQKRKTKWKKDYS